MAVLMSGIGLRVNKPTEDCGHVVNGPYSRIRDCGRESGHDYESGYGRITACAQKEYAGTVYQQPDYGYKDC